MIKDEKQLREKLEKWQQVHYKFHEDAYKAKKESLRNEHESIVAELKVYWNDHKKEFKDLKWVTYMFENMLTTCPTSVLRMHVADCIHEWVGFIDKKGRPKNAELVRKRSNNKGKDKEPERAAD
jgi:hypothetical protein